MSEPILDAHRESDHVYVISSPAPISIRDQILRGVVIVKRLKEAGEIGSHCPLLVVGAGAGGASAAIQAAVMGIPTTLVEQNSAGFTTQRLAATRVIDPTQYDWPLDHCHSARLPWAPSHAPLPLSFVASRADHLAIRWQLELQAAIRTFLHLDARFNTTVNAVTPSRTSLLDVELSSGAHIKVGAIVNAKGFGNEQCRIEDPPGTLCYEGQPFWGPDRFATLNPQKHTVLISGGGDGALQDYLRIVTGLGRAIDIARRCNIPSGILNAIQSAEDRSHRGRSWATNQPARIRLRHEGPYFLELEQTHLAMVRLLLSSPLGMLGLRSLPLKDVPVTIVYPEPYVPSYYGLNRFLVPLLSQYLKNTYLYPGWVVDSIQPSPSSPHTCTTVKGGQHHASGNYVSGVLVHHDCFEMEHDVRFRASLNPHGSGPANTSFNVIIVRHGLQTRPAALQRPRHLLPYHQP